MTPRRPLKIPLRPTPQCNLIPGWALVRAVKRTRSPSGQGQPSDRVTAWPDGRSWTVENYEVLRLPSGEAMVRALDSGRIAIVPLEPNPSEADLRAAVRSACLTPTCRQLARTVRPQGGLEEHDRRQGERRLGRGRRQSDAIESWPTDQEIEAAFEIAFPAEHVLNEEVQP
jgi:hypothetical protein